MSIKSSIISKIMQTENPTQTPMEPPRVEMKVTRVYRADSVIVFTLSDMK